MNPNNQNPNQPNPNNQQVVFPGQTGPQPNPAAPNMPNQPGPNQAGPQPVQPNQPMNPQLQPQPQQARPQPQQPPARPQPQNQPTSPGPAPSSPNQPAPGQNLDQSPKNKKSKASSTQNSLLISEIRDGIVIMHDGSLRSVVMCHSINFDLMSPDERESVEFSYQGFLNSLYFPIQISIRSRKVNLDSYLEQLDQVKSEQDSLLLSLLMEDYIAYVEYLTNTSNIMDKQFFVVVPYYPTGSLADVGGGLRKLSSFFNPHKETITINEKDFIKYKQELAQRTQVVLNGLQRLGIQSIPLNTQELIELYYNFYNPETAASQDLANIHELDSPVVTKGQGENKNRST